MYFILINVLQKVGVENELLLELHIFKKKVICLNYSERYMVQVVGCWKQRCTLGSRIQFFSSKNCCVYLQVKIIAIQMLNSHILKFQKTYTTVSWVKNKVNVILKKLVKYSWFLRSQGFFSQLEPSGYSVILSRNIDD